MTNREHKLWCVLQWTMVTAFIGFAAIGAYRLTAGRILEGIVIASVSLMGAITAWLTFRHYGK
jgi:hypothetical protein